jgi:hypothetical protein
MSYPFFGTFNVPLRLSEAKTLRLVVDPSEVSGHKPHSYKQAASKLGEYDGVVFFVGSIQQPDNSSVLYYAGMSSQLCLSAT